MISSGELLGYALASFVLIVIPGPSVLFVVGRALAHGRRTALATVCGNAAGNYVVAACVALGIGTLVERSMTVFTVVKLAGAARPASASSADDQDGRAAGHELADDRRAGYLAGHQQAA
jgi:hypothetical protein